MITYLFNCPSVNVNSIFIFFTACIAKISKGALYVVIVLPYRVNNCFCIQLFIKRMLSEN